MKKSKIIISTLLCLLPMLFGVIFWDELPQTIATNFDFSGNATGFSSKISTVFGIPAYMTALNIFLVFALNFDTKKRNQPLKMKNLAYFTCPFISITVMGVILLKALGVNISMPSYVSALLAIIFVCAGNYLPKCKQNYTMGIRLPWTLNDEENWNYTHRICGKFWVAGGFLLIANIIFQNNFLLFAILIILCIVPFLSSFKFYLSHKSL
ncbi:MAG: SdpI family protein [Clostridia bacterium]